MPGAGRPRRVPSVDPTPETKPEIRDNPARRTGHSARVARDQPDSGGSTCRVSRWRRDLDIVRALLGQRKLHFYGASYGTQIGANYAHRFPERTGKMVLDGAVDPSLDLTTQAKDQAIGFDRALRRALADCIKNTKPNCPLGKNVKRRHRLGPGRPGGSRAGAAQGARRRSQGGRGRGDEGIGLEPVRHRALAPALGGTGPRSQR